MEGYIDALAAAALGMDAIAVGGTSMSSRQFEELQKLPGPIYILTDSNKEGEKAARQWVEDLYPTALLCSRKHKTQRSWAEVALVQGTVA